MLGFYTSAKDYVRNQQIPFISECGVSSLRFCHDNAGRDLSPSATHYGLPRQLCPCWPSIRWAFVAERIWACPAGRILFSTASRSVSRDIQASALPSSFQMYKCLRPKLNGQTRCAPCRPGAFPAQYPDTCSTNRCRLSMYTVVALSEWEPEWFMHSWHCNLPSSAPCYYSTPKSQRKPPL